MAIYLENRYPMMKAETRVMTPSFVERKNSSKIKLNVKRMIMKRVRPEKREETKSLCSKEFFLSLVTSRVTTRMNSPAIPAETSGDNNHEIRISKSFLKPMYSSPAPAIPAPISEPTIVWVPEIGNPMKEDNTTKNKQLIVMESIMHLTT
eukprot:CAMPEP_0170543536 /NCGR_PEP_ID=MMETSP0211-20121228/2620_1 /TAXON_ID=311385 /ORGANISM="Pseudokeronopsis sp., Strain OXSARD2" /LENGTH=149 /DNA_ID=CAMNT_0010846939 /DNA_START=811 /DNA_END=1260 /DNA_ORIENTATION=-